MSELVKPKITILYDVQKTALVHTNPQVNDALTNPPGPEDADFQKANNFLESYGAYIKPEEIPIGMHAALIQEQIAAVSEAITKDIDPDDLVLGLGRCMDRILQDIHNAKLRDDLPIPNSDDHVNGWVWADQATAAITTLSKEGYSLGFDSGVYINDEVAMAVSLNEQDPRVAGCIAKPFHFRDPLVDCTSLHKGIVHYAYKNVGRRTVMVDDDPLAVLFVTNWVDIPGCVVSPSDKKESYYLVRKEKYDPNRARLDLLGQGGGAIFRMDLDGNTQLELIRRCLAWWDSSPLLFDHIPETANGMK